MSFVELGVIAVGFVGSVCSIAGAIIAFRQARSAKRSATIAAEARQAVLRRASDVSLASLYAEGKAAQDLARTLSAATGQRQSRGTDRAQLLSRLRQFSDAVAESVHHFPEERQDAVREDALALSEHLVGLASSSSEQETIGRTPEQEVHRLVTAIVVLLRQLKDEM